MANNELTLNEFKEVFSYLLDNNKQLEDRNLRPIAVGLEGEAGVGKTSIIEEIAIERGMTLVKVNLAQLEEIGYKVLAFEDRSPDLDNYVAQTLMDEGTLDNLCADKKTINKKNIGYFLLVAEKTGEQK